MRISSRSVDEIVVATETLESSKSLLNLENPASVNSTRIFLENNFKTRSGLSVLSKGCESGYKRHSRRRGVWSCTLKNTALSRIVKRLAKLQLKTRINLDFGRSEVILREGKKRRGIPRLSDLKNRETRKSR